MIIKETWFILANGVYFTENEIEILPYLTIRKINKLSVFELAGLGAKGFKEWSLVEPFCYLPNTFEIVSSENESTFGYDILNRAWLLNTLLVLRNKIGINSVALLNRSWNNLKDPKDIQAGLLDYHVSMIQAKKLQETKLQNTDVDWIRKHFETCNVLAFKSEKFRYAIEVINSWRYCVDIKSAIAIIWAAIESIVDASTEITYRLSLSISSLLCERGEKRVQKFKEIKKLYGLRSKVVHGSIIKEAEIEKALIDSFSLLTELVVFMIENNKIVNDEDFQNAIFG